MQNWDFFGTKFGLWSHLGPSPKFGTSVERLDKPGGRLWPNQVQGEGTYQMSKKQIAIGLKNQSPIPE